MKNVKQLFMLMCCLAGGNSVLAQDGGFFAGINGAFNGTIVANQQNYGQKEMDYDGATFKPSYGLELGYQLNGASSLAIGAGILESGQKYRDTYGDGDELAKDIKMTYISIPVTYKHLFGGKNKPNEGTKFFVALGPQFDLMQKAEVAHEVNGSETSLAYFANFNAGNGNFSNFNAVAIQSLTSANNGDPADDKELFENMDIKAFLSLGLRSHITSSLSLDFGIRVGGSLTDINTEAWRLDGFKDGQRQEYEASRNVFGGLQIGLNYRF